MKISKTRKIIVFALIISMLASIVAGFTSFAFNPNTDALTDYEQYDSSNIYIHKNCKDAETKQFLALYLGLPYKIKMYLKIHDVNIYITPFMGSDPGDMTITASAWPALYTQNSKNNKITGIQRKGWIICHTGLEQDYYAPEQMYYAIGRQIDYIAAAVTGSGYSASEEWNAIYNRDNLTEMSRVRQIDDLSYLNWPLSSETSFADAFRLFLLHPEELKEASNKVYDYMEKTVNNLYVRPEQLYQDRPITSYNTENIQAFKADNEENETEIEKQAVETAMEEASVVELDLSRFKHNYSTDHVAFLLIGACAIPLLIAEGVVLSLKLKNAGRKPKAQKEKKPAKIKATATKQEKIQKEKPMKVHFLTKSELEDLIKNSPLKPFDWDTKLKPIQYGIYSIKNDALHVELKRISDDIYNDAIKEIMDLQAKDTGIHPERTKQMWKISHVALNKQQINKTLQKYFKKNGYKEKD